MLFLLVLLNKNSLGTAAKPLLVQWHNLMLQILEAPECIFIDLHSSATVLLWNQLKMPLLMQRLNIWWVNHTPVVTFKKNSIKKEFRPLFYVIIALPAVVLTFLSLLIVRLLASLALFLKFLSLLWFDRAFNHVDFSKANFSHFVLAALRIVLSDSHQKVSLLNKDFSVKTCF